MVDSEKYDIRETRGESSFEKRCEELKILRKGVVGADERTCSFLNFQLFIILAVAEKLQKILLDYSIVTSV
ncbi:MAG: hypothetical protein DWQ02_12155 [Bacteroidetes bacterium]|nr:MAG: hypothetical protein DWQ02_12155 [Bacteroidota bacterium]